MNEITITIGIWLIPAVITLISFVAAYILSKNNGDTYGITQLICFGGATIASLIVWCIYGLLT